MGVMMRRNNSYHMNIGGASILLVLAIFALTVFAILSLRASYHEMKMAEKNRDAVQAYYEADSIAEEYYMEITQTLAMEESLENQQLLEKLRCIDNIYIDDNTQILTYSVGVNDHMDLQVQLKLPDSNKGLVKIHSWKMITSLQDDYSNTDAEEVWDGIIEE